MYTPLITIVTVVLNSANLIENTLISVNKQTYLKKEYIVIDGVSDDGTLQIINMYKQDINCLISEKDSGLYDAMNKGLEKATGDYIIFLNAGDEFISSKTLEKVAPHLKADKLFFGSAIQINDSICWRVPPQNVNMSLWLRKQYPNHQTVFYPKSFYKKHKFDLIFPRIADIDYTIRAFSELDWEYINMDISIFLLGGISNKPKNYLSLKKHIEEMLLLYKKHRNRLNSLEFILKTTRQIIKFTLGKIFSERIYYRILKMKCDLKMN